MRQPMLKPFVVLPTILSGVRDYMFNLTNTPSLISSKTNPIL